LAVAVVSHLSLTALDWTLDAACADDLDTMFDPSKVDEALALCARCDYVGPCHQLYLEVRRSAWGNPVKGVWANTTEEQRQPRRGPSKQRRTTQQRQRDEVAAMRARVHVSRPRASHLKGMS
jgi:hypothetical protein